MDAILHTGQRGGKVGPPNVFRCFKIVSYGNFTVRKIAIWDKPWPKSLRKKTMTPSTSGSWMRTWHSRHLPQHPSCQLDRSTEEQRFRQTEQGRKDVLLQWSHLQCHVHVFTSDTTLDVVANRDHNCSFKNSGHGWVWYSCSDLMSERAKHSEKQQDVMATSIPEPGEDLCLQHPAMWEILPYGKPHLGT